MRIIGQNKYYTLEEVAEFLGYKNIMSIRMKIWKGKLKATDLSGNIERKKYMISEKDLNTFLEGGEKIVVSESREQKSVFRRA